METNVKVMLKWGKCLAMSVFLCTFAPTIKKALNYEKEIIF